MSRHTYDTNLILSLHHPEYFSDDPPYEKRIFKGLYKKRGLYNRAIEIAGGITTVGITKLWNIGKIEDSPLYQFAKEQNLI